LPRTIKLLEPELFPKTTIRGRELEESLQIYGITQFIMGNTKKSERAFKMLLAQNPNATLDKRYVLDPGIEPYFAGIKKQSVSKKENQASRGSPPARSSAVARPTPPPEVPRPKPPSSPAVAPKKAFSGVMVNSNAARTTVFLDGIFIGSAGQPISLAPGSHLLTLSAEGYESIEKRIVVENGRTANLSVALKKIADAEKPRSRADAPAEEKTKRMSKNEKNKSSDADDFKNNRPKRAVNFNNALPEAKGNNRNPRQQKSLADQFFQEQQPAPSYPQPYPQSTYPTQPTYPQPMYPQPTYPQPAVPYPVQPGYGAYPAPYQAPPVYTPPPTYSYPSPDPYGSAAYPPPPSGQYGAPNPYEEEYEAADGAPPRSHSRTDSVRSSSRRRSSRGGNAALAILPFGIGQFQNGDIVKGGFFLISEGGALGYGLYLGIKVVSAAEKQFALDREAEQTDYKNKTLTQPEIDAKEAERDKYIKGQKSLATWCYVGAGALYVLGVLDAFVNLEKPSDRRRAELTPDNRTFSLGLQPFEEGGLGLKISMKIE
jgi:hypothetical protein